MSAEPSILAAAVARLANPSINLAAYGSVAFPLIGILQAPILTLLSLSTAMSKDWDSFQKGRKLMFFLGGGLTLIYLIITFTPLYYVIVRGLIGAPEEVVEPARVAMYLGVPWSFAVAYRRFHQGVMIRFEQTRWVTTGTLVRFAADALVLILGFSIGTIPGAALATLMMVVGVITEAVFVGFRVRPIIKHELRYAPPLAKPITLWEMLLFFIPLGLTPLLNQLIRPIGSAVLSRLPNPIDALAIWPVISSFSFLIVTPGSAFNEVVIAMLDRPGAKKSLMRFMYLLMGAQFAVFFTVAMTPLSNLWFSRVSGLEPELAELASRAFVLLLPLSLLSPLNSWFSGLILHSRRSRSITEAMAVYLIVYITALMVGGAVIPVHGVYLAVGSSITASLCQNLWLWFRSQAAAKVLERENLPQLSA